jgi:glycosyltransferase involved in cell wall biosynthesis
VIPALNAAATLGEQLDAVLAQEHAGSWEVIVADNGSSDGTQDIVRTLAAPDPRLRLVDAAQRPGVSHARNRGAESASGRRLLFTDADDVVGRGWLAGMAAALEHSRFVAARIDHTLLNPDWTVEFRGHDQIHDVVVLAVGALWPYAYGSTLGIERALHEHVGGFDETLGACEDLDYCYRVHRDAGVAVTIAPDAVVHVRHRRSLRGTFLQARTLGRAVIPLQRRYANVWRRPDVALSPPHLALRAARRLLFPDRLGGRRLRPTTSRAALGEWCFQLGSDIGSSQAIRSGQRALRSTSPSA